MMLDLLGDLRTRAHEEAITSYALERLAEVKGLTVLGPASAEPPAG